MLLAGKGFAVLGLDMRICWGFEGHSRVCLRFTLDFAVLMLINAWVVPVTREAGLIENKQLQRQKQMRGFFAVLRMTRVRGAR